MPQATPRVRETWISVRERLTETDRYFYVPCPEEELERQSCRKWDNPVTLSIVVPLYRTPEIYLNRMITSVMQQSYPHWELILADATDPFFSFVNFLHFLLIVLYYFFDVKWDFRIQIGIWGRCLNPYNVSNSQNY